MQDDDDEDYEFDDEDDDSEPDLSDEAFIQDRRGGGYDLFITGDHIASFRESDTWDNAVTGRAQSYMMPPYDRAVKTFKEWCKQHNDYPNLYYVGERGDVNLLDSKGRYVR